MFIHNISTCFPVLGPSTLHSGDSDVSYNRQIMNVWQKYFSERRTEDRAECAMEATWNYVLHCVMVTFESEGQTIVLTNN